MTTEPKDRLSDEMIRTLREFGLPFEGMIRNHDLVRAKIFRKGDYHQQERLRELGFPAGKWLGSNTKIYSPFEVATHLMNLPTERPVQPPKAARRVVAKSVNVETKRTPKKSRGARR
jgi:hypothetical protein